VKEPSPLEQIDEIELGRAATQDACATAADLDLAPEVAGPECNDPAIGSYYRSKRKCGADLNPDPNKVSRVCTRTTVFVPAD
jgi:hypothetical protein